MALPGQNRLKKKKDLDNVFKQGNAVKGSFLFIKSTNNLKAIPRFGFIIPLKIAGSVSARNRIKRILSETARHNLKSFKEGKDIVVTLKKKDKEENLKNELIKLLKL